MKTLWENMLQMIDTEYRNSPTDFLRQPTISKTVHPNCNALAKLYYTEMSDDPFCTQTIFPGMGDSAVGTPYKFVLDPLCSPMSVVHAYQLYLLKHHLGIFIPQEQISYIVELGGGYGHTCRMVKNFGYTGRYSIIDFPLMLEIQKDFLKQNLINDVEYHTLNMEAVQPKKNETSLFYASFSLNEMPIEQRQRIEPHYNQYDYLFFAYNSAFDGVDNIKYFEELETKLSSTFNIAHFRDTLRGSWKQFMICSKKDNKEN